MLTTGNKQIVINKKAHTPVEVTATSVNVYAFTSFDLSKVISWSANRYIGEILGKYTTTIGDANSYGVYDSASGNPVRKPASFKLWISSARYSSEDAVHSVRFRKPKGITIEIISTDDAATIAGKIAAEYIADKAAFDSEAIVDVEADGATLNVSVLKSHYKIESYAELTVGDDYHINETTALSFAPIYENAGTASLATTGILTFTALSDGFVVTPGDQLSIGGTEVEVTSILSGSTAQTDTTGVTVASGTISKAKDSREATYSGAQLEENVAMGTYENYAPFQVQSGHGPFIDGAYTTISMKVQSGANGWASHEGLGPVSQPNTVNSETAHEFTMSMLEESDLFSSGSSVETLINALITNAPEKGQAFGSDGMEVASGAEFIQ